MTTKREGKAGGAAAWGVLLQENAALKAEISFLRSRLESAERVVKAARNVRPKIYVIRDSWPKLADALTFAIDDHTVWERKP